MNTKPAIFAILKRGQSIGAVEHFMETFNWCTQWVGNVAAGDGIEFEGKDSDHPTIKANIVAGKGINVSKSNGAVKISLLSQDDDTDDEPNTGSGGGHGGSSGSGRHGGSSGSGGGTSGSGGSGGGGGAGGSGGGGSGGSDNTTGTNCNMNSEDISNMDGDVGMYNDGDNCSELNGW